MKYSRLHVGWLTSVLAVSLGLSACPKRTPQTLVGSGSSMPPSSSRMDESAIEAGDRVQDRVQSEEPEASPLEQIYFDFDSFALSAEAEQILQMNAEWLKNNTDAKVEIEGHCDNRGTAAYNLALGAKRAKAAHDYLIGLGIPSERLSTITYGEELPVCNELNESCWQRNRRGHFQVINR